LELLAFSVSFSYKLFSYKKIAFVFSVVNIRMEPWKQYTKMVDKKRSIQMDVFV